MVADEPDWQLWALWLALQLHLVLRRGARQQDRDAARRALDEFSAEIVYELGRGGTCHARNRDNQHLGVSTQLE